MVAADRTSAFKTLPLTFLHLELTDKGKCKRQAGFCILQCSSWPTRRNGEQRMTRTMQRYLYDVTFTLKMSGYYILVPRAAILLVSAVVSAAFSKRGADQKDCSSWN